MLVLKFSSDPLQFNITNGKYCSITILILLKTLYFEFIKKVTLAKTATLCFTYCTTKSVLKGIKLIFKYRYSLNYKFDRKAPKISMSRLYYVLFESSKYSYCLLKVTFTITIHYYYKVN